MSQHDLPWLGQGRQQPKKETSNMKKYKVTLEETHEVVWEVEAKTSHEAVDNAEDQIGDCKSHSYLATPKESYLGHTVSNVEEITT